MTSLRYYVFLHKGNIKYQEAGGGGRGDQKPVNADFRIVYGESRWKMKTLKAILGYLVGVLVAPVLEEGY